MEPREEPFDLPAPLPSTERPPVLGGRASTIIPVTRNHLDAVRRHQPLVERIAVVGFVADQAARQEVKLNYQDQQFSIE
jgi:hypothetical protein